MKNSRVLLLTLAFVLTCLPLATSLADDKPLTAAEQTWLSELSRDPARVRELMQAEETQQRMDHWDTVTQVAVIESVLTTGVDGREPRAPITGSKTDDTVYIWFALETPRYADPFPVQVQWKHEGELMHLKTIDITAPSYRWRSWDMHRLNRPGTWSVSVVYAGRELATKTITVTN